MAEKVALITGAGIALHDWLVKDQIVARSSSGCRPLVRRVEHLVGSTKLNRNCSPGERNDRHWIVRLGRTIEISGDLSIRPAVVCGLEAPQRPDRQDRNDNGCRRHREWSRQRPEAGTNEQCCGRQ